MVSLKYEIFVYNHYHPAHIFKDIHSFYLLYCMIHLYVTVVKTKPVFYDF